ncbi:MAG TPA: helix-hairpin-helix domain-containing protein [Deltaproteobacteria bacterium]|nr:helix-hairpin-helix domain-containing protein [Deltaproteobacteria bacterium]HQJ08035.1 helix-hairpin-helix domain-containing protein [Deltaproteobacteria bacterium]
MKRCTILAGVVLAVMLLGSMAYGQAQTGQGKININTATIEELRLLPGVGDSTANNILAYRKANGPFKTLGDVVKVKGIGEKKFKKLQVYLKLDGKSDFEPVKKAKPAKKEKVTS